MPSDDLVLNVRQIAGYTPTSSAPPTSSILMQLVGLGGPYAAISPQDLVGTALSLPGASMAIGGELLVAAVQGGSAQFSNAAVGVFNAQTASILNLSATLISLAGIPVATIDDVAATVTSFNFRNGAVMLEHGDIICAGGAPIASPAFVGCPTAPSPSPSSNSNRLATTSWVNSSLATLTLDYAPLDSPNFSGVPTAPTAALGSADGQIATTAFVMNAVSESTTGVASFNSRTGAVTLAANDITGAGGALLASPTFTGAPAAPTATPGTSTSQLATTAFVAAALSGVIGGVASFNSRTGAVTLTTADITGAGGALLASTVATFNGRSGAVNLIANDISGASGALLASPAFSGTPTAPTPALGDNSTRLATTAFVASQSGFAPLASPAFSGIPTAPTAAVGVNTTQLATTAYVLAAVAASTAGVSSFNSRTGAVTLAANDISAAGGALLASPLFTGTPAAPTAAVGVNTTQLATTAYVLAAGFAPLASPTFTGTPAAPTAAAATSTTQIATTAFVRNGVTNGSNAAAGQIGEFITASASANMAWNSPASPISISLTPGDWDVWGSFYMATGVGGTLATGMSCGLSTTINAFNIAYGYIGPANPAANAAQAANCHPMRFNVTAATTVYFTVGLYGSAGTTLSTEAFLYARRVR
jgi:hypothetical protein